MDDPKIPIGAPTPGPQGQQPQQQQVQIPVDTTGRESVYANFFQAHMNSDEVILDFGQFSQVVTPGGMEPISVSHRVVMNFYTAKRLAEVLRQAIARHEQMFGVVELDVNRRLRQPPTRPPGT